MSNGVARIEASEAILAQELTLRAEALVYAVNSGCTAGRGRLSSCDDWPFRLVVEAGRRSL